jgi:hypothetical protein
MCLYHSRWRFVRLNRGTRYSVLAPYSIIGWLIECQLIARGGTLNWHYAQEMVIALGL